MELISSMLLETTTLERGFVCDIKPDGDILVELSREEPEVIMCDILKVTDNPLPDFNPGDQVLVHWDERTRQGCILGRVMRYEPPPIPQAESKQPRLPDSLVVEAGQKLTLRCGEGTITITRDGRILIKGKDVISRAKRNNRIKGGAVQIN